MERSNSMTSKRPGLYEFLIEAELQQYYAGIKNDLKVQNVSQLKYVTDEDLHSIGMAKPEIRRLKKFFQKHFPQNYLSKIKKMILPKKEEEWESMVGMLPEEGTLDGKPPIKVPNKHIIPADNILVNKELGTGEFGVVQQGVWTNDGERIQVAIKCLSRERMQNNPIEFLKEAAIMHGIDDEHIVRLYGVVLDTNALMLVTELAPLRSLLECLKEPSLRASFPVISLCNFAVQICSGMQYLEMKRLIHRDLAARNILVFSKNKVKISDFGLSRALGVGKDYYQTNFNVNLKLPIAWCAPECISYLRFTSASDVWAFGVTLWEMFSYGFQPWAALTGHQILEAIDEPNLQRLEQPECCPKEYYSVMLKCWQHDPNKRPRFVDLMNILPDCKPEQVQAVQDSIDDKMKRDQLSYRQGDVITVLDKGLTGSGSNSWKGVLNNGKSGFFNPAHTVTYLGANLPSNKGGEFMRGDGKNTYSSRRSRLRPDMISCPQGDVKHTSHIGLDGAYFGDISFLGGSTKYNHIPHQVVMPYKHEDNTAESDTSSIKTTSDRAPLLTTDPRKIPANDSKWLDCENVKNVCAGAINSKCLTDHEYHEISDEECVAESPRFEKTFDFGPSLLDEMNAMFRNIGTNDIGSPPPSPLDVDTNKRNELREIAASLTKSKKKQATVKPISAADEKALDSAIALANEIAACSMNDLDNGTSQHGPDSPRTPASPNKRKFSFRFPTPLVSGALSKHSQRTEGHTFTDEAASIPDIQNCLSTEAKAVYDSLIEKAELSQENQSQAASTEIVNPLKMLKCGPVVRPRGRGSKSVTLGSLPHVLPIIGSHLPRVSTNLCRNECSQSCELMGQTNEALDDDEGTGGNAIPLPPRDRSSLQLTLPKPRHQRKHPLIIPGGGVTRTVAKATAVTPTNENPPEPAYLGLEFEQPQTDNGPISAEVLNQSNDFDLRIASELEALDNLPTETNGLSPDSNDLNDMMLRSSDHVSCEDLLEFACDQPNSKRTSGKARGIDSDEVRIMRKVLGLSKVTDEQCLSTLNVADWNVHRAIKLVKLQCLLNSGSSLSSLPSNQIVSSTHLSALESTNWDVSKAATLILSRLKNSNDPKPEIILV
ncbi:unnamed protein product [Bemisia tabaci]|uniref:non-specific protein-tyrosine kinase n=1 Tax=Bemisia tabaci TaxID=7038 RepID=A0A9P0C8C5_BEMTA|nr:PREDICTED: tyrosine-protein kinase PR2 isoform X2 [Bemisia tabaci]CAH0753254.1 unnamed protein product [Bemisia tabaci]